MPNDPSRRQLLITIGQLTAGVGAVAKSFPAQTIGAGASTPVLPPGVFLPSPDHLGHALMHSTRYRPIPPGCPTDYVRPQVGPYQPVYFSASEFAVVQVLVCLLLEADPQTTGNLTAEIAQWIDLRMQDAANARAANSSFSRTHRILETAYFNGSHHSSGTGDEPGKICREGIRWLDTEAQTRGGRDFLTMNSDEQRSLLNDISDVRPTRQPENPGTHLYAVVKAETVRGFYTSEAGLRELGYKGNAFYARSPGCPVSRKS
jgi:hypothetical protein